MQEKKDLVHGNTEGLFEAGEEFTLEEFAKVLDCDNKPENLQRISLVYIAEKRLKDTEKQLEFASLNEKDLLMELEAITASSAQLKRNISDLRKERDQLQSKLLASERKVFDLHAEMKESGRKLKALQEKEDLGCNYRLNQDRLISDLQSKMITLESELKRVTGVNDELEIKGLYHGTAELETKEKLEALDQELVLSKGNVDRLQKRCEDLTQKYESERKRRLESDRDQDGPALKRSKSKSGAAVAAGGEDSALLDISLNMLRCSVCKDRFKEVAITRCFHLFCKECIESNIANRNRKCPMCGEKFGQDDVKKVHFTN
jgi:E3 ubiquitin-protein ligase BRE1